MIISKMLSKNTFTSTKTKRVKNIVNKLFKINIFINHY